MAGPDSTVTVNSAHEFVGDRTSFRARITNAIDWIAFVVAGVAAAWYAVLSVTEAIHLRWWIIPLGVLFWAALAYLVLPRLNRILTTIYVPGYFIGRTRTTDGLLGDPVNLAFMGDEDEIRRAMSAAGWTVADPVTIRSSWRIITATLLRRSYAAAPVSPLLLFERKQDIAFEQEVSGNPSQRHHIRFWRTPPDWPLPGGVRVDWLAAATFDRRVGLSLFTLQVTHKVASDTDRERDHVVETLRGVAEVAVHVLQDALTAYRARNGGGDSFYTDGALPIVDVRPLDSPATDTALASDAGLASGAASRPKTRAAPRRVRQRKADARPRPQPATFAGVALVALRVLAGLFWLVTFLERGPDAARQFEWMLNGFDPADIAMSTATIGVVVAAVLLLEAVFAFLMWQGRGFARTSIMVLSTAWITFAFFNWAAHVTNPLGLHATLLMVGFDILLLLALSSHGSAGYTNAVQEWRARRRAAKIAG